MDWGINFLNHFQPLSQRVVMNSLHIMESIFPLVKFMGSMTILMCCTCVTGSFVPKQSGHLGALNLAEGQSFYISSENRGHKNFHNHCPRHKEFYPSFSSHQLSLKLGLASYWISPLLESVPPSSFFSQHFILHQVSSSQKWNSFHLYTLSGSARANPISLFFH